MKNQLFALLATACLLLIAPSGVSLGAPSPRDGQARTAVMKPDEKTISDAYIYLLGRLLMLHQERTDIERGERSYNRITYEPLRSGGEATDKIAFHTAWIAVDDSIPVIVEIPKIDGRRYAVLIVDEWGNEITNINPQTFPSKPSGAFALVKAGSNVKVPDDATRIMLHSGKARMLAAIELLGDPTQVETLRRLMTIKTLFKPALVQKRAERPPKIPALGRQTLVGVEIFDDVEVIVGSALDVMPAAPALQEKARFVARYVRSGSEARLDVATKLMWVISSFQTYVRDCSKEEASWFNESCKCDEPNWCRAAQNYKRSLDRAVISSTR